MRAASKFAMAAYRVVLAHGVKGIGFKVIIAPDGSDAWAPPIRGRHAPAGREAT